jgi:hypothetical protein
MINSPWLRPRLGCNENLTQITPEGLMDDFDPRIEISAALSILSATATSGGEGQ